MGVIKVGGSSEVEVGEKRIGTTTRSTLRVLLSWRYLTQGRSRSLLPTRICTRFYFPIAPHVFNMIFIPWGL
jgi:hypothetical protein